MDKRRISPMIKRIHWGLDKKFNDYLKEYDLTFAQANILRFVKSNNLNGKIVTQRDIEKYLNASNPTVSGLLDRLEDKGYIRRIIDDKDARRRIIVTTEKSANFDVEMVAKLDSFQDLILQDLSLKQQDELFEMLDMITKRIKEIEGGM